MEEKVEEKTSNVWEYVWWGAVIVLGAIFTFMLCMFFFGDPRTKHIISNDISGQEQQTDSTKKTETNPKINKEEFDSIKNGMSYEEVVNIVGGDGELLSETGTNGDQYHTMMYSWEGEKGFGSNANTTFQNGKLVNKAQFGLK